MHCWHTLSSSLSSLLYFCGFCSASWAYAETKLELELELKRKSSACRQTMQQVKCHRKPHAAPTVATAAEAFCLLPASHVLIILCCISWGAKTKQNPLGSTFQLLGNLFMRQPHQPLPGVVRLSICRLAFVFSNLGIWVAAFVPHTAMSCSSHVAYFLSFLCAVAIPQHAAWACCCCCCSFLETVTSRVCSRPCGKPKFLIETSHIAILSRFECWVRCGRCLFVCVCGI